MKAKRLFFLVMAICLASGVKAQFYDSADDIYYYVEYKDGRILDDGGVFVFNFDGQKACFWDESVSSLKNNLKRNPSYYEDKVETTDYCLKYISNNTYQYKHKSESKDYYNYSFSHDRMTLYYLYHRWVTTGAPSIGMYGEVFSAKGEYRDDKRTYKKVEKSYFKVGRSRTPSGTMYD